MTILGLDLGERRIGVAVSVGSVAVPHGTVARSGDPEADRAAVARLVDALGAERVIVGLPLSLDGSRGPAARGAEAEASRLGEELPVPVELFDERLTTVTATRSLRAAGVRSRSQRKVVDQVAATVFLQAWLDGRTRGPNARTAEGA
jgi:putative Holliday junction resolvase